MNIKNNKQNKIRKVFLDDLPTKDGIGNNKGNKVIDWIRGIGYRVRFIYEDIEGYIEIVGYDGKNLFIKYLDKEPFKITTGNFQKCKIGRLLGKITNKFRVSIGEIFKDDKRDLVIIDRKQIESPYNKGLYLKYYKYHCNKCGFECGEHYSVKNEQFKEVYWIEESNLLKGNMCACCTNQVVIQGINDIYSRENWMVKYFLNPEDAKKYTRSSNKTANVKCPDCGQVKDKEMKISDIYKKKSIGCSCGDGFSYGHKYVYSMLKQLEIDFIDNDSPDWCKFYNPYKDKDVTGEYDFVIEDMKLIIEVDGGFHRNDNKMNGQTKEESKFLDSEKEKLANNNGYKEVIRIKYNDDLNINDNILSSELIHIFDFSNIDWNKCETFALSNRVLEACELKRDNPEMTCNDIGKIMKLSGRTIITYFKKGSKIWDWINYNPKEERIKVCKKHSKSVEIFKDDISLGEFSSSAELERKSEELFGVKLDNRKISLVCLGKQSHHKGFAFKYI